MSMQLPHKEFEKPPAGQYYAVLADIVDLGEVTTTFNGQTKKFPAQRFVWILNFNGKDGQPLQVSERFNVSSDHEKSNIYKKLKMILGYPPAPGFDYESLVGQTRILWITRDVSADGTKDYANIMGIMPAPVGVVVPIPAGFVRAKFKAQTQAQPAGAPAPVAPAPVFTTPAPVNAVATGGFTAPPASSVAPAPVPAGPAGPVQGKDVTF